MRWGTEILTERPLLLAGDLILQERARVLGEIFAHSKLVGEERRKDHFSPAKTRVCSRALILGPGIFAFVSMGHESSNFLNGILKSSTVKTAALSTGSVWGSRLFGAGRSLSRSCEFQ